MPGKKRILSVALFTSILVMMAKLVAWYITRSNSILSDALESFVNVAAGAFALYSVSLASLPRDENHPYGHGKIEFLSAGLEGMMVGIAGFLIIIKATYNLIFPQTLHAMDFGIAIVAATGFINLFLALYLRKINKPHSSIAIDANSKHLLSDAITSGGLLLGLILIYLTEVTWMDNMIAIGFGSFIFITGYRLVRKSVAGVMDEADYKAINEIINVLNKHRKDNWIDVHNFRIIKYGNDLHIDCHMTLPWYYDLKQVHETLKEVEDIIHRPSQNPIEIFVHADPCIPSSCRICELHSCPVRQHPFEKKVVWELGNIVSNKKHDIFT